MRAVSKYFPARLVVILPVVLATACQSLQAPSAPTSRLNIAPTANQATTAPGSTDASGGATYTVKRDSLKQSLSLQGRVAPTRSAQLTLHGGGTVTAVTVQAGQAVKQGDSLAEFAADDQSLQAARAQATLAELAYEQELTKLNELQTGTPKDTVDQAQAVVARDKAAIAQINQQTQAAQDAVTRGARRRDQSAGRCDGRESHGRPQSPASSSARCRRPKTRSQLLRTLPRRPRTPRIRADKRAIGCRGRRCLRKTSRYVCRPSAQVSQHQAQSGQAELVDDQR